MTTFFRNLDYNTRAERLERLKRKQKSRKKVAMFERFALTDPLDDVQITPIPFPPAEPAPMGMLDGIYPQEDRESKPITSLDYGILETHMADDGAAEDDVKPITVLKGNLASLVRMVRTILPYVDPMYRPMIKTSTDILFAWAVECRMVEDGKRGIADLAGIGDALHELHRVLLPGIKGGDKLLLYKYDEKVNTIMDAILKDWHKLA